MVVRELLACMQPSRHKTSTALWNPYRRVSSRRRHAQIRFSRGTRGEKPEIDRPPFWLYGESIRTSVINNTAQHNTIRNSIDNSIVGMSLMVYIAVEACRRRAASTSIYIIVPIYVTWSHTMGAKRSGPQNDQHCHTCTQSVGGQKDKRCGPVQTHLWTKPTQCWLSILTEQNSMHPNKHHQEYIRDKSVQPRILACITTFF